MISTEKYDLSNHNYSENLQVIENINDPEDLCYSLFTTGTTGKPKGVLIKHNNLINYCFYTKV